MLEPQKAGFITDKNKPARDSFTLTIVKWSARHAGLVIGLWLTVSLSLFLCSIFMQDNRLLSSGAKEIVGLYTAPNSFYQPSSENVLRDIGASLGFLVVLLVVMLLTAFGTVAASLVALALTLASLLTTYGLVVLTRPPLTAIDLLKGILVALIGLGTTVDYGLFMVSRFRFHLRKSRNKWEALQVAGDTSGRVNFASAGIWTIALGGLFVARDQALSTIALATLIMIGVAVLGSVTLVPALLILLGDKINWGRLPYFGKDEAEGNGLWGKVVLRAARWPRRAAILAVGLLLALSLPLLSLKLLKLDGTGAATPAYQTEYYSHALPLVIGFVLSLTLVLLLVQFRSLVLALEAVMFSLLSTGAALGAVILVFELGWFKEQLGFETGLMESGLPLLFFPLFFGFSMSYQLLAFQRIKERRLRGTSTRVAATHGVRVTSGVVVSAGAIMRTVLTLLIAVQFSAIQQFGLGMLAGIYLDAILVRCVLLPATLQLLGRWRWSLPFGEELAADYTPLKATD